LSGGCGPLLWHTLWDWRGHRRLHRRLLGHGGHHFAGEIAGRDGGPFSTHGLADQRVATDGGTQFSFLADPLQ
jgi:hypothetical protein